MSSIIQQLKLWDQLIEQRIKFEELMHKCNSLPQEDTWSELLEQDDSDKLVKYQKLAEEKLLNLFEECVQFEKAVEELNPNLLEKHKDQNDDEKNGVEEDMQIDEENDQTESDEEELDETYEGSDLDNEEENYDEERPFEEELDNEMNGETIENDETLENDKKLIDFKLNLNNELDETIENIEAYLSNRHDRLNSVRNDILNYWFEKTRFTLKAGKLDKNSLDAFEQSIVKSIDHLLLNRLKLIKRTQLKRGNYEIIGKKVVDEDETINSELVEKRKKEVYDTEIFDDSDFYHQLLRELVNSLGATNLNNTSKVNPRWLKLMKERFKSKKYVDTKATKARKIRYKVHNELVNFMTPLPHLNTYDDEQHSNLVKSIFGNSAVHPVNNELNLDDSDSD